MGTRYDGLQIAIYTSPGGQLLANWSADAQDVRFSFGDHGPRHCSGFVPMDRADALRYADRPRTLHLQITDGARVIWAGRLENPAFRNGLQFTAYGYWRALFDVPYTAMWVKTSVADWNALTNDQVAGYTADKYELDNNNRIYIAPRQ